ncbi:protein DEHYDRATION-INDUCED 19 homolog 4-like isoform X2 [Mangifera indica]|uniref:protein DEHYDRATION-INDUCED 19 homolog 4-like isoform X2 n=1 Tax=Mangifera indica TaxID=29780 RepID=UPI001CF9A583|nr:protein DEHYDRATION-INDUCED 19 homolog 4-like isoform X2 [Mangifera indica]
MESNSWNTRLSTSSSRRYQNRSDLFIGGGFDETDGDEEFGGLYLCPFCAEDFDIVGLCCHIEEDHPVEAKNGVCPVCAKRVGMDIVSHITMQHGSFFKVQRKRRLRRGTSNSTFSLLRKEVRDGTLQSLLGGSSCFVPPSNTEPDPLLSSFIFSSPSKADEPVSVQPLRMVVPTSVMEKSDENFQERNVPQMQLSDKDQEEKARRSAFVRGLVLSTVFDDFL